MTLMNIIRAWRKIAYGVLVVGVTATFLWLLRPPVTAVPEPVAEAGAPAVSTTVADAWRWDRFPAPQRMAAKTPAADPSDSPFNVAGIHAALRDVALTESGEVVLDDKALTALRTHFATLDAKLTVAQVEELQQIIRTGLPGKAGEQAAKIVGDYYQYHAALQDLQAVVVPPGNLQAVTTHYEQLVALRQQYLGYETAERLFGDEQAFARYTMDSMRLEATPGLSEEQKHRAQAELQERVPPGVLSVETPAKE